MGLLIKQQIKQFRALNNWFRTPLGLSLSHRFSQELLPLHEFLCGETLLQLSSCGNNEWLPRLRFEHQWIASPFSIDAHNQLECSLNQLPLSKNSVDCVVVPLTLEPFGHSSSVLDEIDRILKPMGYVVFLCMNPWSLWGLSMKCGLLNCFANNEVKLRSPYSLNRQLLQRGYRQMALSSFGYIPPVNNSTVINRLLFLDEVGKMLWPFPAGFYCYVAQKYEYIAPNTLAQPGLATLAKDYPSLQPIV